MMVMHTPESNKRRLREEIMITIKANGLSITGELWLTLVFRSEAELKKIAAELNIKSE